MRVKNLFKKLILMGLILGIVFSFLGIYKVYAQEKLSKGNIIKKTENTNYIEPNFINDNKVMVNCYSARIVDVGYFDKAVNYVFRGKISLSQISKLERDCTLGWSLDETKLRKTSSSYLSYLDNYENTIDFKDDEELNNKDIYEYFDYAACEADNTILNKVKEITEIKNLDVSFKAEILENGKIKLYDFKTKKSDLYGDLFAKIDFNKLNVDYLNLKNPFQYYMDDKLVDDKHLPDYFSYNHLNFPEKSMFYMTQYITEVADKDILEDLLTNDYDGKEKISKYLYAILRIPQTFFKNKKNYIIFSPLNNGTDNWKDRIKNIMDFEFFGITKSIVEEIMDIGYYVYELDYSTLINVQTGQDPFLLNSYKNVKFTDKDFKSFFTDEIYNISNNKIHDRHVFYFGYFNKIGKNIIYPAKNGSHNITKLDDLIIKNNSIQQLKKTILNHIANQIDGKKLDGITDEEYELKSNDDLFSLDDTELEKLNKEYQEFFDNPGSYSKTYKMKLTINKDFLHKNYVPYDKSTWEPDMDLYLNIVFSKPVINIEFRNYYKDNDIYTFYTTNLDNYSFLENIKVTERKHNEEINISYKAVVNDDTLNLYRLDNPNFKLNSNPIKFKILKFPAELIGNKSWYLIKTNTVSNEDIIKHYKIQSLDGDKYMIDVLKNPMLEKGDNVKNGYLELDIISTTNLLKSYTYLIPVYRDSKLETKFKNDTDDAKYFNSSNPQLVNQVIHPLKYKLNVDKIRDRFLYASLFDKAVNIEAVNKNNYYKSVDLVYKQVYLAKDDDVSLENQATHTITYAANRAFNSKFFISSAGTGNYMFHKSSKEKMSKEELLSNLASFYQGKIDSIRLSKVDIKGKNISNDEQNKALDRFTKELNTTLKERIFIEGIKNGERVFVNQFILENVEDNYFISKDKDNNNPGKKEDPSITDEAKSFLTDYKMYFIIAGSGILGLIFLLIVLKIVFPSKKERKKKLMKLLEKNAYSKDLRETLSEFFISRKYKKDKISEVVKTINTYLDKKIPENEIIEIINNAIRNEYDNLDFTSL